MENLTENGDLGTRDGLSDRAVAQWFPAGEERLHVARSLARASGAVQRALRIHPEKLVHTAYGTDVTDTNIVLVALTLFERLRWPRVSVRVEFWTPLDHRTGSVIGIRWSSQHLSGLFPVLEGSIGVREVTGSTLLELDATYRPPGGIAGLVFDKFIGRRVALRSTLGFVDSLCDALERDEGVS